jgi:ABC-2 type transport system ATP-binding protein
VFPAGSGSVSIGPEGLLMTTALQVTDLSKSFGPSTALRGVSFSIPRGSLYGLVGPNGAGKTTLLSLVAGFLIPDSGFISILGMDAQADLPKLRGRFSMLVQDAMLPRNRKIRETLTYLARLGGLSKSEALMDVDRVLTMCGLTEQSSKRFRQLSHGMAKRLHVAQAFLGRPELIFLDEPTSGLDPENAAQIRSIILKLAGESTVVISSHNLAELEETCTDLAILDEGKVAYAGSMSNFLSGGTLVRWTLDRPLGEEVTEALRSLDGMANVELKSPTLLHMTLEKFDDGERHAVVKKALQTLISYDIVPRIMAEGARLEERFLEEVGRAPKDSD